MYCGDSMLKTTCFKTPLGLMRAVADEQALYVLQFADDSEQEIDCLQQNLKVSITSGRTLVLDSIETELEHYFSGTLQKFKTPLFFNGSQFQQSVWRALQTIPYGHTTSYAHVARAVAKPLAFRAVGAANGANKCAIIIPCHRVINADGALGGYASGLTRKQWLLDHEKKYAGTYGTR